MSAIRVYISTVIQSVLQFKKGKQHVCLMANKKIIFEVSLLPCLIWSSAVLESSYLLLESLTSIHVTGEEKIVARPGLEPRASRLPCEHSAN